jgi:hypothetical protein
LNFNNICGTIYAVHEQVLLWPCVTRRCYGSLWPKVGIAHQLLVKACHIEFQEYLSNGLGADARSQTHMTST